MEFKEKKAKIQEAIKFCDTSLNTLIDTIRNTFTDKGVAAELEELLVTNAYFAGGVFRSIFTSTQINDVDMFFRDLLSLTHFNTLHYGNVEDFAKVFSTSENAVTVKNVTNPISICNTRYGEPNELIKEFDFSFNQHWYHMHTGTFKFDKSTFNKVGYASNVEESPIPSFIRYFRFKEEGFKYTAETLPRVLAAIASSDKLMHEIHQELSDVRNSQGNMVTDTFLAGMFAIDNTYETWSQSPITDASLLNPPKEQTHRTNSFGSNPAVPPRWVMNTIETAAAQTVTASLAEVELSEV